MVIAGGGISGLALAAALQAAPEASRPKVIVMERDASAEARRQGYGVTLSETNAALAGLGILEDLRASNTRSCAHWTFKDDGAVLGYFGLAFLPEERGKPKTNGVTNLRVPRNRVREILLRRLLPGTVRFGCRVVDYEEVTNDDTSSSVSVVIETQKNTTPSPIDDVVGGGAGRAERAENDADTKTTETVRGVSLLVASDGVRSAVQRIRMPGASLNYLGVVLITGFTTLRHPLLEKQGFYTLDGARARIFTMPFQRADDADADADEKASAPNDRPIAKKNEKLPPVCTSMWQISVRVTEAEAMALAKAPRWLVDEPPKLAGAEAKKKKTLTLTRGFRSSRYARSFVPWRERGTRLFRRCSTRRTGTPSGRGLCTTGTSPRSRRPARTRRRASSLSATPRTR